MDTKIMEFALSLLDAARRLAESGADAGRCLGLAERAAAMAEKATEDKPLCCWVVRLESFGGRKIHCIKVTKAHSMLGLKEAKELVEKAPCDLLVCTSKAEAEDVLWDLLVPCQGDLYKPEPVVARIVEQIVPVGG